MEVLDALEPELFPAWGNGAGKAGWSYSACRCDRVLVSGAAAWPEFGDVGVSLTEGQLAALREMPVSRQIEWHEARAARLAAQEAGPDNGPLAASARCLVDVARVRLAKRLAEMPRGSAKEARRLEAFRERALALIADGSISANCGCRSCKSPIDFRPAVRRKDRPAYQGFRP